MVRSSGLPAAEDSRTRAYALSMSTTAPSRRADLVNRALQKQDFRAHVDDWLAAGDDQDRLAAVAATRRKDDAHEPPSVLLRKAEHVSWPVLGGRLHRLRSKGATGQPALLYLHGGYYVVGPHPIEWMVFSRFARKRGLDLLVLDYPKVPEFSSEQTIAAALEAWGLVERRYGAGRTAVVGSSAGGGLALSLAMSLRDAGRDGPACVGLSSPWLDLACAHPELSGFEDSDLILTSAGGRRDGELYAGPNRSVTDPLISAYYADPGGLPPLHIQVGANEMFFPECRDFAARCETAGVETELVIDPAGQHCGLGMPSSEGGELRNSLGAFIAKHIA